MKTLIIAFILLMSFNNPTFADGRNFQCNSVGASNGNSTIKLTYNNDAKPFYSVAVGETIASFDANVVLNCALYSGSYAYADIWVIQAVMNTSAVANMDGTVCDIGVDGIGIQVINSADSSGINCRRWDDFFVLDRSQFRSSSPVTLNKNNTVRLIKTRDTINAPPGNISIDFSKAFNFSTYSPGYTGSETWGQFQLNTVPVIKVDTCSLLQSTTAVSFDQISIENINSNSAHKPFSITFGNCGSSGSALNFNKYSQMRFTSSNISSQGDIKNDDCPNCATGLEIRISDSNNNKIDLNNTYSFSSGTSTILSDSVKQNFLATLVPVGKIKTGRLHANLVFEISHP